MYKVLLVDDEILDLKGMQTFIPWQELGMEVVEAVTNGFAASEVIERERIDILITDVRMPNMSGLELARKALDLHPNIKIIFVSGYQDFHYVKQALSLNACSYVVKPMDDNELIESLRKLRIDLDEEQKQLETELLYQRMFPIVKTEYLLQLLEGTWSKDSLESLIENYQFNQLKWPVQVVVVERDDWMRKRNVEESFDETELSNTFWNGLISLCKDLEIRHYCRVTDKRMALLIENGMELDKLKDKFNEMLNQSPISVTTGVGEAVSQIIELNDSYRKAQTALDYKVFYGKGKMIFHDAVQSTQMKDVQSLDIQLDALFEAMTNYELVKVHDELEMLYSLANNMRSKFTIQNFTMFLLMKLDAYLQKMNEDLFRMLNLDFGSLDILLRYETIDEIHSWLRYRVYELSEMLQAKKHKKNWKLVQDIIDDVKQRLHENITLKDVAEKYSFSPNYLGQIFKEEMKTNFSDYVAMLRMEKAGDLLINTNLKVYEIANLIGYRYLPYFSRQFKDYHGKTPLEYRRKL
ncbi:response regulator [Paenibacillus pinisoli]|uniref:Response regulator n=1 Tax=Paenibacillus pinisoli TaxID=1276110 RepID=A0A3A6PDR8_9BACL|nr:response regulator [Paenibacillus pinisoli]RJX39712.1 response regulator [Paenibacillus pinisoli]